jgi:hypothetical protein
MAMRGSLGEKIGEGVFADIHAWAPGQVVKLFKASVPRQVSWHEARMTRAVFAAGGPAPEVLDEVTLEGRFGIVLPRLDGPTLLQLLRSGAIAFEQAGAILASLYMSVHKTPPPPDVLFLHDLMDGSFFEGRVPKHIATGILALIERLRPGDGLCHTDLHPGNVIMTADGPRIIDWACALRASGVFDIARVHVSLSELVPDGADPERPRVINATVQSEYARQSGLPPAALTEAMQPYLPILRAFVLLQRRRATPAQRKQLIQRLEATLRS